MSLNPRWATPGATPAYSIGWSRPTLLRVAWPGRAMSPPHSGATADVPPIGSRWPSTTTWYPVTGSALPATSGTPRPVPPPPAEAGTPALAWYDGNGNTSDTPPPPAPSLLASSFHTTSDVIANDDVLPMSWAPPQASASGDEAGKSQCTWVCSLGSSLEPLSPAATVTVTPSAAPSANASFMAVRDCAAHWSSDWPQLIETAIGVGVACTAWEIASMNPWSVLLPKYTTWTAPGATPPMTSMSSSTSPSADWPGEVDPPSTPTAVTEGTGSPSPEK